MILEAKKINKYYSSGKVELHVLNDINLNIAEKEIVAIVGPSGAGKSTLLHILGGLDSPSTGDVLFEGRLLSDLSDIELSLIRNKSIGFVFQFYHLLPEFSVLENVMMPAIISHKAARPQGHKLKATELLENVGLIGRMRHFPSQLSGGEQQRVAIARALINEPKLLLCDEPTGNLDSENGAQICELLKKLNRQNDMTVVLVTHNLDVANISSKRYNIINGNLQ